MRTTQCFFIKPQVHICIRVHKKDGTVRMVRSTNKRRITALLQTDKLKEADKYELQVKTGSFVNTYGQKVEAKNFGEYFTLDQLKLAFHAFTNHWELAN